MATFIKAKLKKSDEKTKITVKVVSNSCFTHISQYKGNAMAVNRHNNELIFKCNIQSKDWLFVVWPIINIWKAERNRLTDKSTCGVTFAIKKIIKIVSYLFCIFFIVKLL